MTTSRSGSLSVAVDDPAHRQIVGRELDADPVAGQDSNVIHAHLAANVGEDFGLVLVEFYAETGVREVFEDGALDLDTLLFVVLWPILRSASTHSFLYCS